MWTDLGPLSRNSRPRRCAAAIKTGTGRCLTPYIADRLQGAREICQGREFRVRLSSMGTAVERKCLACSLVAISANLPFCAVHHFKLPFELRESLLRGELV